MLQTAQFKVLIACIIAAGELFFFKILDSIIQLEK